MALSLIEIALWSFLYGRGSVSRRLYPFLMVAALGTGVMGAFLYGFG